MSQNWACLGCWISQCYGPFLLGAHFETYEPFISLIFQFFLSRSKPQITETTDTESADTRARLYYTSPVTSIKLRTFQIPGMYMW
jgi:hypothetical protein